MPVNPQSHVACAINIHPVLYVYHKGVHVESLHLKVTLDGHWITPDVKLAVRHFLNRHLRLEAKEADASKPFDYYRAPEAQQEEGTTGSALVEPRLNAGFLERVKGAIVPAAFDSYRPCSLPTGSARSEALISTAAV